MAANYYREQEHAFIRIERDLKSGNIPRVVLLCGREEYLINWYTESLIKKYVSDACRAIDAVTLRDDALNFAKIEECLETVSLMSERKVVILPEFAPADGKTMKGFTESEVKALAGYIKDIPDGSMLVITVHEDDEYSNRKKSNILRKTIEKYGNIYDFQPLNDKLLRGFIEKRLRMAGKKYMNSVVNRIISSSGYGNKAVEYSLYNLDNDLKKITAHSDGDEITEADVVSVLSVSPENNVFAMLDAIGKNRKDEAFRMLGNLMDSGTPVFSLIRLIANQIELILSVKEMKERGMTQTDMQKKLAVHQFRVKKALSLSSYYSVERLKQILMSAYEIDANIKTGLMENRLALEYFVALI